MKDSIFIEVTADKFHEFIMEVMPKHVTSENLISELNFHRFHSLSSFKKDFINEIMNNYYGMHYVGMNNSNSEIKYKLTVVDKKLCTFFLLKYGS
jgi:hypothetical protein